MRMVPGAGGVEGGTDRGVDLRPAPARQTRDEALRGGDVAGGGGQGLPAHVPGLVREGYDAEEVARAQALQRRRHEPPARVHRLAGHGARGVEHEDQLARGDLVLGGTGGRLDQHRHEPAALPRLRQRRRLHPRAFEPIGDHEVAVVEHTPLREGRRQPPLAARDRERMGGARGRGYRHTRGEGQVECDTPGGAGVRQIEPAHLG